MSLKITYPFCQQTLVHLVYARFIKDFIKLNLGYAIYPVTKKKIAEDNWSRLISLCCVSEEELR